jgi:hypothetical protein
LSVTQHSRVGSMRPLTMTGCPARCRGSVDAGGARPTRSWGRHGDLEHLRTPDARATRNEHQRTVGDASQEVGAELGAGWVPVVRIVRSETPPGSSTRP